MGALSTRPWSSDADYVKLPRPDPDDGMGLNRFMVVSKVMVGNVEVQIGGLHLEWFGDPASQTAAVADYFESVDGPAIILGDFNLEPPGFNVRADWIPEPKKDNLDMAPPPLNLSAWAPLMDAGWTSTTPFECEEETDLHICKSALMTAMLTKTCEFPCWGYQLGASLFLRWR